MHIGIVGAGIAGLTAAYELGKAGHRVTVYEAAAQAGGLASGFRDGRWDWPLERFYHHIFTTDKAIIALTSAIGLGDKLFFRGPVTAQWWRGRGVPLDSPTRVLRFDGIPFAERVRFGAAIAYLKYATNNWQQLERTTAAQWSRRWMGDAAYRTLIRPLLEGKFGPYADEVNMAWLWARFKARSFKLGYYAGGFQALADGLVAAVERHGARVLLGTPVMQLAQLPEGGWQITPPRGQAEHFDAVIVTGAPGLLSKLTPQIPPDYLSQLSRLRSMGAVVLTVALRQPLTDGIYWMNMPKDQFPFLALVEHTNFIAREHYGGDTLIYCGDYLEPSHPYFQMTPDELLVRFLPALRRVNPRFEFGWVRDCWLHREPYAQPIVPVNHSRNIPPLATPLPGLFWASMSQVYPWDRGTNFAVEIGQRVAAEVLQYTRQSGEPKDTPAEVQR